MQILTEPVSLLSCKCNPLSRMIVKNGVTLLDCETRKPHKTVTSSMRWRGKGTGRVSQWSIILLHKVYRRMFLSVVSELCQGFRGTTA